MAKLILRFRQGEAVRWGELQGDAPATPHMVEIIKTHLRSGARSSGKR